MSRSGLRNLTWVGTETGFIDRIIIFRITPLLAADSPKRQLEGRTAAALAPFPC